MYTESSTSHTIFLYWKSRLTGFDRIENDSALYLGAAAIVKADSGMFGSLIITVNLVELSPSCRCSNRMTAHRTYSGSRKNHDATFLLLARMDCNTGSTGTLSGLSGFSYMLHAILSTVGLCAYPPSSYGRLMMSHPTVLNNVRAGADIASDACGYTSVYAGELGYGASAFARTSSRQLSPDYSST